MSLFVGAFILVAASAGAGPYRLPWEPTATMELTQDCNDSFYADHVGSGKNAWDFANGTHFRVSAARAGVVTHIKMSSHSGCDEAGCVDLANYIVVDHGDGTASLYLHVEHDSLDDAVGCGKVVRQGQHLASAGSTGWSTGPHLHFQVNAVHASDTKLCECGEKGVDCPADAAAWTAFWSTPKFPSLPVAFDEWPANACSDRRMALPISQNVEHPADARLATTETFSAKAQAKPTTKPVALGIGGRGRSHAKVTDKSRRPSPEIRRPSR